MRSLCISLLLLMLLTFAGCAVGPTVLENKASPTPYPRPDDPPPASTFGLPNTAPTLKPIITSYYKAIDSRNDAALRKVVTAHFIESYENALKGTKMNLVQYLTISEDVKRPLEIRNEIFFRGDAAAQVRDSSGKWTWVGLAQENDVWKVTDNATIPAIDLPD